MKHSFRVQVIADIELSDDEFYFLFNSCEAHYDLTVRQVVQHGGFMSAWYNSRALSNNEDKKYELTFRQIDLLLKSIEFIDIPLINVIRSKFKDILDAINDITTNLNQQLSVL